MSTSVSSMTLKRFEESGLEGEMPEDYDRLSVSGAFRGTFWRSCCAQFSKFSAKLLS
ncbi:hypothetical protein GLV89_14245 [Halomonas alkaliantarctica]|nr:hypothetical protein [Halomonas alkaliantarctica]